MPGTIELYNIMKGRLGEEISSAIAETFEEVASDARIEYKGDLTAIRFEMATKADIAELRTEFRGEFKKIDSEFKRVDAEFKAIRSEMATKTDIAELRGEIKSDIAELKGELKSDIAELKGELKSDIAELKGEFKRVDAEFKAVRSEMATKADIAELKGEFKRVDGEFKRIDGEFKSIRMEMKLYFLILLFVILATNPKTIDLVTKLLSVVK
jgi:chromosome segregation ATPase